MQQLSEQFDQYQKALIEELRRRLGQLGEQKAQLEADTLAVEAQLARAQAQAPQPDACPQCFVWGGQVSTLCVVDHDVDEDGAWDTNFDKLCCGRCGYEAVVR